MNTIICTAVLAAEVRAQTTMPLSWIAERLAMGSRGYLAWLLCQRGKQARNYDIIFN
ncbi:MAG TPA: hypothetical protein VGR14_01645 [Verrucomicrobiae bacterium]|jgi:hypothetical protein|nr:hypothetical protein [Verrucomicrobiae bacterium]